MTVVRERLLEGRSVGEGRRCALRVLGFSYGEHRVFNDVSFDVSQGSVTSVLGPNGVGKSTLFKCVLGLLDGYEGKVFLNGKDASRLTVRQRAAEVSYIPQGHANAFDYKVVDVVLMGASARTGFFGSPDAADYEAAELALTRVGMAGMADRSFSELSGGQQQLVLVARALSQRTRVVVMDEPTSALDFGNTARVLSCVRHLADEGLCVVMSTHQPDQAFMYADRVVVLDGGKVVASGPPRQALDSDLVSRVYGVQVQVCSLFDDDVRVCVPVGDVSIRKGGEGRG